eukprot:m.306212 g.306212  ORF g.306212 m.306212 type:complete len:358 (+) comp16455_c0_seq2:207-1280(+)
MPGGYTTVRYYGGEHQTFLTPGISIVICGTVVCVIGFLLCLFVISEMILFRKLRFQLNRMLLFLLSAQAFTTIAFAIDFSQHGINPGLSRVLQKCPAWVGQNALEAMEVVGIIFSLQMELMIVIVANFSLFYIRRDIDFLFEVLCYGGFGVTAIVIFSWCFTSLKHKTSTLVCNQTYMSGYMEQAHFLEDCDIAVASLIAVTIAAYVVLSVKQYFQKKIWARAYAVDKDLETSQERHNRLRVVEAHRNINRSVVKVIERYLVAFLVASTGYIIAMVADFGLKAGSQTQVDTWTFGLLVLRNTQAILQALVYIFHADNRDNFSLKSFSDRYEKVRTEQHVQFLDDPDLIYAADGSESD